MPLLKSISPAVRCHVHLYPEDIERADMICARTNMKRSTLIRHLLKLYANAIDQRMMEVATPVPSIDLDYIDEEFTSHAKPKPAD